MSSLAEGLLSAGVCATSPDELIITPTTDAMSVEHSWVLCGHELYHHGNRLEPNYQLDLNEVSDGSTVGVMVTRDGDLHFSLNGLDMGCAVRGVPTGMFTPHPSPWPSPLPLALTPPLGPHPSPWPSPLPLALTPPLGLHPSP